jgi:trans-aconitate methyltransferase
MAANTSSETLGSVYIADPLNGRERHPLYQSVRELVGQYSVTGHVLDIGCSDGVATLGLEDKVVFGLDIDSSALMAAKQRNPNYLGIQGDIRHLPLNRQTVGEVDTVLLLDILEHESFGDTAGFLRELHGMLRPDHTLIASMPIISPLSIDTWSETMLALRNRRRPETGLLDRTHQILTNRHGHLNLFKQAGYSVVEEYQTNHIESVSGDWQWKRDNPGFGEDLDGWIESFKLSDKSHDAAVFMYKSLAKFYKRSHHGHPTAAKLSEALVAYQGIYVLKPDQSAANH